MPLVWHRTWQSSSSKKYAREAHLKDVHWTKRHGVPYYEIVPLGSAGWQLAFIEPIPVPWADSHKGRPPGTAPAKTSTRFIGDFRRLKEAEDAAERDFEENYALIALSQATKNPKLRWSPMSWGQRGPYSPLTRGALWPHYEVAWSTSHGGRQYLLIHRNNPEHDQAFFFLQRAAPGEHASSRGEMIAEKRMPAARTKRDRAKRSRLAKFWAEEHIISPLQQLAALKKNSPIPKTSLLKWERGAGLPENQPGVKYWRRSDPMSVGRRQRLLLAPHTGGGAERKKRLSGYAPRVEKIPPGLQSPTAMKDVYLRTRSTVISKPIPGLMIVVRPAAPYTDDVGSWWEGDFWIAEFRGTNEAVFSVLRDQSRPRYRPHAKGCPCDLCARWREEEGDVLQGTSTFTDFENLAGTASPLWKARVTQPFGKRIDAMRAAEKLFVALYPAAAQKNSANQNRRTR